MSTVTPSNDFVDTPPEVQSSRVLSPAELNIQETQAMEDQQRKLKYFSDTTNEEREQQQEHEVFLNLSLVELFRNLSATIIVIINEVLEITKKTTLSDIIYIFIKGDRLVYLGMLMIMIALAMYLIDITGGA